MSRKTDKDEMKKTLKLIGNSVLDRYLPLLNTSYSKYRFFIDFTLRDGLYDKISDYVTKELLKCMHSKLHINLSHSNLYLTTAATCYFSCKFAVIKHVNVSDSITRVRVNPVFAVAFSIDIIKHYQIAELCDDEAERQDILDAVGSQLTGAEFFDDMTGAALIAFLSDVERDGIDEFTKGHL